MHAQKSGLHGTVAVAVAEGTGAPLTAAPSPPIRAGGGGGSTSSVPPSPAASSARAPLLPPSFHPASPFHSPPPQPGAIGLGSVFELQLQLQQQQQQQLQQQQLQQQQLQQQEEHQGLHSPLSSASLPFLPQDVAQQQALLPIWQQQISQLLQLRQPSLQLGKSSQPDEALLTFQASGLPGNSSGSGSSTPRSLLFPIRAYADATQQQIPMHATIEQHGLYEQGQGQLQTQPYLQQALYMAHKVPASLQQRNTGMIDPAANSDEADSSNSAANQNFRQLQGRHDKNSSLVYNKVIGQLLASHHPLDKMHEARNEFQSQQVNIVRPTLGNFQNQQHLLMNGLNQMHSLQSYPLDPTSAALLASHPQYISQQLLPHLQAHLAASQKVGYVGSTNQQPLPVSSKSQTHLPPSLGHDLGFPNKNLANAPGYAVPEEYSAPCMAIGDVHSGLPSRVPSSFNLVHAQNSASQPGDLSVGTISMNRTSSASAVLVPAIASKPSYVAPTCQKLVGTMAPSSSEQSQLQHFKQPQDLLRLSMNSNDIQISNAFSIQQAMLHQQSQYPRPQTQPQPQLQPQGQQYGFTRQQLLVLKSQILAFRRLKRGEQTLPLDVLRSIGPASFTSPQSRNAVEQPGDRVPTSGGPGTEKMSSEHYSRASIPRPSITKVEESAQEVSVHEASKQSASMQQRHVNNSSFDTSNVVRPEESQVPARQGLDSITDQGAHTEQSLKSEHAFIKSSVSNGTSSTLPTTPSDTQLAVENAKKIVLAASQSQKASQVVRRYRGPLYDFPPVAKKVDGSLLASSANNPWGGPIPLGYDARRLLLEEGIRVLRRRRFERLRYLDDLLSSSVGKRQLPSEFILKLKIEQRKLRLMKMQAKIREEVEQQQQEIMAMGDRGYRKFVRLCERQRVELARQVALLQKTMRERHVKALLQWRKRLLEAHWVIRDGRTTRNRGVAKYHERLLREYSKRKDEDRNRRMEALKNNDVDAYREMLKQQQTQLDGDAGERYEVLSSFLTQTEDYLQRLGGKISAVKIQQEREEAACLAALVAKSQGLSEEEIQAAASQAMEEVEARNQPLDFQLASVNKYYSLAHAVNERVFRQPSMLRAGILRDYQLVGLQWMLSLYNNHLNGILADEMGLGKTVQVMALIAYLMELKGNNGPHLIIVPNAVIVNWKSELLRWLPSVSCIFYVGVKDYRAKLYTQDVCAMKFNVLVTTYEFIMRDRAKLSKVEWKYLIIDEAQRMKDRESRLARDLDRFRCQRRLLLTGTPLQNDLKELWSLLNLLLPEVFDNSKAFHDWFSTPFQKDGPSQNSEDDWLETEKKVIVIHRLHQILEPFVLRRRVEDVEGSLPQKVCIVLRCRMSALQAAIYDWIKTTGTIRLDPDDEAARVALSNGKRQMRAYTPLQNKCMELRKVCNHPFLNYPSLREYPTEFAVRSCGKLWMLDRILTKLHKSGHRVLLFSTMTKLLDILEEYLQWRSFTYRRIDGTTTLESRESAIDDFNRPGSDCFIFLLSIRAAGRGLNLQSADTVIIYDPDANPKNEEQAVARAHRIGQKREVRVLYMEAVVETITSYEKEDELRSGGILDVDDEMAGKDRYVGSIESLVRNTIQQFKIDMADEVINAGRFDQRTTQEERRLTLEALLHDEERYQDRVHDVPTMQEVNRMIARSQDEVELFDQMDDEYDWFGELLQHNEIPKWLHVGSQELNAAITAMSRQASKRNTLESFGTVEEEERLLAETSKHSQKRNLSHKPAVKGKRSLFGDGENVLEKNEDLDEHEWSYLQKNCIRKDEETEEELEQGVERDVSSDDQEEGEIREEIESDEDGDGLAAEQEECELLDEEPRSEIGRDDLTRTGKDVFALESQQYEEQDVASESSQDEDDEAERTEVDTAHLPTLQKFGSLAALESRPANHSLVDDLEEGEIVASGDSPFGAQASQSSGQEKEEDEEEEQLTQPQVRRKRSARHIRKRPLNKLEERSSINYHDQKRFPADSYPHHSQRSNYELDRQHYQLDRQLHEHERQMVQRFDEEGSGILRSPRNASMVSCWKSNHWGGPPPKRLHLIEPALTSRMDAFTLSQPSQSRAVQKPIKKNTFAEDDGALETSRENMNSKTRLGISQSCSGGGCMPESSQKKCRAVLQKLLGAVNKDGRQIAILFQLPKRNEFPGYYRTIANPIDAHTIEQHLDHFDYSSVLDFAADVQLMLDNAARYYSSAEVKADARRLQALFFQRMGLNFPDVNFGSVKTRSLTTLNQLGASALSSKQSICGVTGTFQAQAAVKEQPSRNALMVEENIIDKKGGKKVSKDNKVRLVEKGSEKEKSKRKIEMDPDNMDDGIRHPVDLIFCRKKRKYREKVRKVKLIGRETSSVATVTGKAKVGNHQINKGAGVSKAQVKGSKIGPTQKAHIFSQAGFTNENKTGSQALDQWLTPVKKMRTDSGKRRPSHI